MVETPAAPTRVPVPRNLPWRLSIVTPLDPMVIGRALVVAGHRRAGGRQGESTAYLGIAVEPAVAAGVFQALAGELGEACVLCPGLPLGVNPRPPAERPVLLGSGVLPGQAHRLGRWLVRALTRLALPWFRVDLVPLLGMLVVETTVEGARALRPLFAGWQWVRRQDLGK